MIWHSNIPFLFMKCSFIEQQDTKKSLEHLDTQNTLHVLQIASFLASFSGILQASDYLQIYSLVKFSDRIS